MSVFGVPIMHIVYAVSAAIGLLVVISVLGILLNNISKSKEEKYVNYKGENNTKSRVDDLIYKRVRVKGKGWVKYIVTRLLQELPICPIMDI